MFSRYTDAFARSVRDDLAAEEAVLAAIRAYPPGGMAWHYGLVVLIAGTLFLSANQGTTVAIGALALLLVAWIAAARLGFRPAPVAIGVTNHRVLIYRAGDMMGGPREILRQYRRDLVATIDSHRSGLKQDIVLRFSNGTADQFEAAVRERVADLAEALRQP